MEANKVEASFRDPDGFIFKKEGQIFRSIAPSYVPTFNALTEKGINSSLITKKQLLHYTIPQSNHNQIIIQPDYIEHWSYPYEWCFSQLKKAALLTLDIQKECLEKGFSLKDASAFNIQFLGSKPVFIDHLSFEQLNTAGHWVAYRQFCEHFIAPLCFHQYNYTELTGLMQLYPNGIPLRLISSLLPWHTKLLPFYLTHVHLHAKLANTTTRQVKQSSSSNSLARQKNLITHLHMGISEMTGSSQKTVWSDYYDELSYTENDFKKKQELIDTWLKNIQPQSTVDLGCNTGTFSFIASKYSKHVTATDFDIATIERLYTDTEKKNTTNILPLVLDINQPSAAIGWNNTERLSFWERFKPDTIMALALIHHLAIGNNVPLDYIASMLANKTQHLIIEFVSKQDVQVKRMLLNRKDIFSDYEEQNFINTFEKHFQILVKHTFESTTRTLFLMKRK